MTATGTPQLHLCLVPGAATQSALRESVACLRGRPDARLTIFTGHDPKAAMRTARYVERRFGNVVEVVEAGPTNERFTGPGGDGGDSVLVFMPAGDWLDHGALDSLASAMIYRGADIVYLDEDAVDDDGRLGDPRFKPDANYDYLVHYDYVGDLLCISKAALERYGGIDPGDYAASRYALLLRALAEGVRPRHIPRVLYHSRGQCDRRGLASVLREHFEDEDGIEVLPEKNSTFRIRYPVRGNPLTTIVIPFRDRPRLLRQCLESVLATTANPNFELLGISNCSLSSETYRTMEEFSVRDERIRFAEHNAPFNFSALVNRGVELAAGDYIVLMNNDITVINGEWLDAMLEYGQRDDVGVVGAKLLYPDGSVQHAGLSVQQSGHIGHMHRNFPGDSPGYMNRLICVQTVTAVTAALCLFSKALHRQLNGFDEERFGVALNDVDFCLRAGELGHRNIFTPYALACHHESRSRGYETTARRRSRFAAERAAFWRRHQSRRDRPDPNYNLNLDQYRDDFTY